MAVTDRGCEVGLIGLGVMGRSLGYNMADDGYSVVGYDRDGEKIKEVVAGAGPGQTVRGNASLKDSVGLVGRPLVDTILHKARQKGTGEWSTADALELEVPTATIDAAVVMRDPSVSVAYVDAYHSRWLPASLIQAQHDFFGAHVYEGVDRPGVFHTEWDKL